MFVITDLTINFQNKTTEENVYSMPDEEDPRQYYLPGEQMKGVVAFSLTQPLKIIKLSVCLVGSASVSWELSHKRRTYHKTESYLDEVISLLDIASGKTTTLPTGGHQFSFSYILPEDIPSSFNGVYGSVTYVAKAVIDCDDESLSTITNEPFMVLRRPILPVNMYEPSFMRKSKFYYGFKSGKIKVKCSISRSAAVPGDTISIDADVANWSGKKVSMIHAAIVQESFYYAKKKDITFRLYLNTRQDHFDTDHLWGRKWHNILMLVPPYVPDSELECCNLIDVRYIFQFKIAIENCEDIILETPLYIGHHPPGQDNGQELPGYSDSSNYRPEGWSRTHTEDGISETSGRNGPRSSYSDRPLLH